MRRGTSVFLDLLRLGAAAVVFLAHTTHYWGPAYTEAMLRAAHQAVVVFFALSGYVIAGSARDRGPDGRRFAAARLARLYSVVVPALGLTALLWAAGSSLDPGLYAHYVRPGAGWRYLLTLLHLNEVWFFDAYPPGNVPFWSLGYEAPYYVLFGIVWFVRPPRKRWLLLAVAALVFGPKVLVLMPAWLAGAAARLWRERVVVKRGTAAVGCVVALAGIAALLRWAPEWPGAVGEAPWCCSGGAVADDVVAAGWAALIWCFDCAWGETAVSVGWTRLVRWVADHTFSLYLFHAPIVIFVTALMPPLGMGRGEACLLLGAMLLCVMVLGAMAEALRPAWRRGFEALLRVRPAAGGGETDREGRGGRAATVRPPEV